MESAKAQLYRALNLQLSVHPVYTTHPGGERAGAHLVVAAASERTLAGDRAREMEQEGKGTSAGRGTSM